MEKSASLTSGYAAVTEFGTFMQTCSTEVYSGKVWIDNLSFEIIGNSSEKFNDPLNIARSFELNSKPQNLNFEK